MCPRSHHDAPIHSPSWCQIFTFPIRLRWIVFPVLFLAHCSFGIAQKADTTIQLLLKEGDSAFAQGEYDAARRAFEDAEKMTRVSPFESRMRYDVLKRLTFTSAASGQFAGAEHYLEQAIECRKSLLGAKDPKIADDLVLSVNLNMRMKQYDDALTAAQRVEAIHTEAYSRDSIPVAEDLLRIAQIYIAEKKPNEATGSVGIGN